jgi:hypothetical protein
VVESLKTYGVNEAIQQAIVNQIRFSNTYAEINVIPKNIFPFTSIILSILPNCGTLLLILMHTMSFIKYFLPL